MVETDNHVVIPKHIDESLILVDKEVENGKNKHLVKCLFCPSKILNPGLGTYLESEVSFIIYLKSYFLVVCLVNYLNEILTKFLLL